MTKRQIKILAKLYAANVVLNSLGCGADSEKMTEAEHEIFAKEVDTVAHKMVVKIIGGIESFQIGDLDTLVEYVKNL